MDTKALHAKLNTIDAWKAIKDKGMFAVKPKKNLALWQEMEETDVLPLYDIRRDQHESSRYAIFAFSTKGELSQEQLLALSESASQTPLNAIRFDAMGYAGLGPIRTFGHTLDENDGEHDQISLALTDEANGLFIFVCADRDEAALDAPYVAYGRKGRSVYVYPLTKGKLQSL
ncbi:MAG: hypothetical protein LBD12_04755 [Clostridiales Family XIII bacterium]|jgi:hypothetical protein|nr:hypothetical protein [Clostridiales Family XIII bacterium]